MSAKGEYSALSPHECEQLLEGGLTGHLGCVSQGKPYVVPISYVVDGDFIYSHSAMGKKIEMMRENPSVCLQVEEVVDPCNWRSVIAWGKYEELKGDAAASAMRLLSNRLNPHVSSLEMDFASLLETATIFRIHVSTMTGRREGTT